MSRITKAQEDAFFEEIAEASKKAVWCALATVAGDEPRVRIVHPTWEGQTLWLATGPATPKARQIANNGRVDVQFQVAAPDFVHVMARGHATLCSDDATRAHAWEVMDYDLKDFFPGGPTDPNYVAVRVTPTRVELSRMFGTVDKRVWRA
jgi:general stress protein 26